MSKYLTKEEINKVLMPIIEKIEKRMTEASLEAANIFYGFPKGTYDRTGSFASVGLTSKRTETSTGYILEFEYKASDVSVNPWGKFPGSNGWSFDADYIHGFHGGPRRAPGGGWTWKKVPHQAQSPFEYISEVADSL